MTTTLQQPDLQRLHDALSRARVGKRVVHCHGVFDLLHLGHIRHLQHAKSLGDLLVVTVTADRFVNKGPDRPAFTAAHRVESLLALNCVDFAAVNDAPLALPAIEAVRPDLYVKGSDYANERDDPTGGIAVERRAVEALGGRVVFTDDLTFSSSRLLNQHFDTLPATTRAYLNAFAQRFDTGQIRRAIEGLSTTRVLLIGETIIDHYQYCEAIGKSSKEPVLAVKQLRGETFAGGILAASAHTADYCQRTSVLSVLGRGVNADYEPLIREKLSSSVAATLLMDEGRPTIVKRRFIDGYFFQKLFEVYEIDEAVGEACRQAFHEAIVRLAPQHDVVIVIDFGHGLMDERAVELVCEHAPYLAVNAQSNAGNLGYNTIGKYPRADFVCVAEKEMRLETRNRTGDLRGIVQQVTQRLRARRAAVTRGSAGCLTFDEQEGFSDVPAVATQVKDRVGAGDAFLAISAPLTHAGWPMEMVGLIGNAAGGAAAATIGHRDSVKRAALIKHLATLLK